VKKDWRNAKVQNLINDPAQRIRDFNYSRVALTAINGAKIQQG